MHIINFSHNANLINSIKLNTINFVSDTSDIAYTTYVYIYIAHTNSGKNTKRTVGYIQKQQYWNQVKEYNELIILDLWVIFCKVSTKIWVFYIKLMHEIPKHPS